MPGGLAVLSGGEGQFDSGERPAHEVCLSRLSLSRGETGECDREQQREGAGDRRPGHSGYSSVRIGLERVATCGQFWRRRGRIPASLGSTCGAREKGGHDAQRNAAPIAMLIDTHAHLNDPKFAEDLEDALERARDAGVSDIVVVGYDWENSEEAIRLAREHSCLHATVGIHPSDAATASDEDFARIVELAGDEQVVAIGETGLDLYHAAESLNAQVELLRRHYELAAETGKPLIVHNRSATRSCMDLLEEWGAGEVCAILHCFDGHAGLVRRAAEMGCFVGLDGPVTFPQKKSETREPMIWGVARAVSLDHLLIETDCPWLSPVPRRGRRNEPAYVAYIAARIAELRGISVEEVAEATTANARRAFRFQERSPEA